MYWLEDKTQMTPADVELNSLLERINVVRDEYYAAASKAEEAQTEYNIIYKLLEDHKNVWEITDKRNLPVSVSYVSDEFIKHMNRPCDDAEDKPMPWE